MAEKPEALNALHFDLFVKILRENMPSYDRVEKMAITPYGTVDMELEFDFNTGQMLVPPTPGRLSDYEHFSEQLSTVNVDRMVEAVIDRLAKQLAGTIESLITETSAHGTPICADLFVLSNGSANLETIYCVKGNQPTLDDPTGSITGWFAYKVKYAIGTKRSGY
jgi:hypothetical protein